MTSAGDHTDPETATDGSSPLEGFSTSFGAFFTVGPDDHRRVLTTGLIVPDANVLLNLYRYTPAARADFLRTLRALRDQLWIPRQVAHEYWTNREKVVADAQRTAHDAVDSLKALFVKLETELNTWSNRVSLQPGRLDTEKNLVAHAFESLQDKILQLGAEHGLNEAEATHTDPVLAELESILNDNIGPSLSPEDHAIATQEGLRRNRESVPPGYKDKGKSTGNPIGDYILWEQTLREAETRRSDVLMITNDTKEDWWRKDSGEVRGPRPELHEELRLRSGGRLFMMRPQTFLKHATDLLNLTVSESTITQVRRVGRRHSKLEEDLERVTASRANALTYDFISHLNDSGREYAITTPPHDLRFGEFELAPSRDLHGTHFVFEVIGVSRNVSVDYFEIRLDGLRPLTTAHIGFHVPVFLLGSIPSREVEIFFEGNEVAAGWPNEPTFGDPARFTGTSAFRSFFL